MSPERPPDVAGAPAYKRIWSGSAADHELIHRESAGRGPALSLSFS
jgi:hypothetical protein